MSKTIRDECDSQRVSYFETTERLEDLVKEQNVVAIHVGSAQRFVALADICARHMIPIINGSTDVTAHQLQTAGEKVAVFHAPNLALSVIRLMSTIGPFIKTIGPGLKIELAESHQKSKVSIPGTACEIAKAIGISTKDICSIRDRTIQLALGVPYVHLDAHAFHDIILYGPDIEIRVSIKITGCTPYARGALVIAKELANKIDRFEPGLYQMPEVLYRILE